jgi:hypothetical protein
MKKIFLFVAIAFSFASCDKDCAIVNRQNVWKHLLPTKPVKRIFKHDFTIKTLIRVSK